MDGVKGIPALNKKNVSRKLHVLFACKSSIKVWFIADQYLGNLQLGYAKTGLGVSFPWETISDLKSQTVGSSVLLGSSVLETICLRLNSGSSGEALKTILI